jgi:hypothetical protein
MQKSGRMVRTFEEKLCVTKKEASQAQAEGEPKEKKNKGVKVCLFLFISSRTSFLV